jgi:tetratricopeptide (TPR) repeat protein
VSVTPPCPVDRIEPWEVLDLLSSLVQKSLVVYEEDEQGQGRYGLMETMRQYSRDRLMESGEAAARRFRHLEHYLALAEEAEPEIGADPVWLERLEIEHDNLRTALDWCTSPEVRGAGPWVRKREREHRTSSELTPDPQPVTPEAIDLRLVAALGDFWTVRNHQTEGRQRLAAALAASENAAPAVRAKALGLGARFAMNAGDDESAAPLAEESLALCQQAGDRLGTAHTLGLLSEIVSHRGDPTRAVALAEECLALHREIGNRRGVAAALTGLGARTFFRGGDRERGLALVEEGLAIGRAAGDRLLTGNILRNLGLMEWYLGQAERAIGLFVESLAIFREFGDGAMSFLTLAHLAYAARSIGDQERVFALLEESVAAARGLEMHRWISSALRALTDVAHMQGNPQRSKAFFEQTLVLAREQGDQERISYCLHGLARAALAENDLERARMLMQEGESFARTIADPRVRIHPLGGLGHIARELGEFERAAAWYRESLELRLECGNEYEVVQSLEDHAILAAQQGRWERAARLLGAVETLCAGFGRTPPATFPVDYERALAAARAALGEVAFASAWAEGQTMLREQAVTYALEPAECDS